MLKSPTTLWMPGMVRVRQDNNGEFTGGPNKGLLHSTEARFGSGWATFKPGTHSHLEYIGHIKAKKIEGRQYYPFDQPARALVDGSKAIRTNRDGVIQLELGFQAAHVAQVPDWFWEQLADELRKIEKICHINPDHWAHFLAYRSTPPSSYGVNNGVRFTDAEWNTFDGWCGHMHVGDGNSHGDPGDIPVNKLKKKEPVVKYHVLKKGDTVASVAKANGLKPIQLWKLNHSWKVGDKIRVK